MLPISIHPRTLSLYSLVDDSIDGDPQTALVHMLLEFGHAHDTLAVQPARVGREAEAAGLGLGGADELVRRDLLSA
jgi:hypothetical protein